MPARLDLTFANVSGLMPYLSMYSLAGGAEVARGAHDIRLDAADVLDDGVELGQRPRPVAPGALERAGPHLLEAEGDGAVDRAAFHRLAGQPQRGGAGRAVVVDIDHRDPGQTCFVRARWPAVDALEARNRLRRAGSGRS